MPVHEQKKNNIKEISGTKIKENRYKQNKGLDSTLKAVLKSVTPVWTLLSVSIQTRSDSKTYIKG